MRFFLRTLLFAAPLTLGLASAALAGDGPRFVVTMPAGLHAAPITGRVYVAISKDATREPREGAGGLAESVPFFGKDIHALRAGEPVVIDGDIEGYPTPRLRDLPAGDYYVQAILSVYTRFPRADGHVIWAHNDQWEGQQFGLSPGNLVSRVVRVHFDPKSSATFTLPLARALPPIALPPDTAWVKHVKIQSALLTKFWGVPMYLGAVVLLPKGYDDNTTHTYPTVYEQGHFTLDAPFGFDPNAKPDTAAQHARRLASSYRESRYDFTQAWADGDAPPMVAVTFQHPTPYYDDSYAVDSVNEGPYGTAIMTELIPYLEAHFRLIPSGNARFLIGGSTGGWEALALQIYHPTSFNGTWGLYPDPVDFHRFQVGNLYDDENAFSYTFDAWNHGEIPAQRRADGMTIATMREESRLEYVRGTHGLSTEQFNAWDAAWGPIGSDGYPREFWDKHTGAIDHTAVAYARDHGFDLTDYLAKNWSHIGPQLVGKIHVDVGDADDYFLNLACYRLQAFLEQTQPAANAVFTYGRPLKPHGFQARPTVDYLRDMAARAASAGTSTTR
jgi:hypothetical protein